MRILVRAPNWVGDAVMSMPALRAIQSRHPEAEIAVLARPWVAELYRRDNSSLRLLLDEASAQQGGVEGRLRLSRELRAGGFDWVVLLPNSFDSALVAWLARIPRRIGYARDGRSWLLTDPVRPPAKGDLPPHQRFYYLELLRRAGLLDRLPDCPEIRIPGDAPAGRQLFRRFGLTGSTVVGVSPGAAFGGAKRWPPERFAKVAARLAEELEAEVALFGAAAESELCAVVAGQIGPRAFNLAGRTSLGQFIDLAAACACFLTNDSGAMHIASAVGVPTVAVFGPTDAEATGPAGPASRIVRVPVECSPCLLRECPIDHRCMLRVEAAGVEAELRALVEIPLVKSIPLVKAMDTRAKIVSLEQAEELAARLRGDSRPLVVTAGGFDVLQAADARFLRRIHSNGAVLLVAVYNDTTLRGMGQSSGPVLGERARAELVAALETVDYVLVWRQADLKPLVDRLRPDHLEFPAPGEAGRNIIGEVRERHAAAGPCEQGDGSKAAG